MTSKEQQRIESGEHLCRSTAWEAAGDAVKYADNDWLGGRAEGKACGLLTALYFLDDADNSKQHGIAELIGARAFSDALAVLK